MEIFIDKDLYYLFNLLLDLDNYKFDYDVTRAIEDLTSLVCTKLTKDFDFDKYDINSEYVVYKFYPNKRKNN